MLVRESFITEVRHTYACSFRHVRSWDSCGRGLRRGESRKGTRLRPIARGTEPPRSRARVCNITCNVGAPTALPLVAVSLLAGFSHDQLAFTRSSATQVASSLSSYFAGNGSAYFTFKHWPAALSAATTTIILLDKASPSSAPVEPGKTACYHRSMYV